MTAGSFILLSGSVGIFLSVMSLWRVRDKHRRRKTGLVLGLPSFGLVMVGMLILHPDWWARLLLIGAVLILLYPLHRELDRPRKRQ